MGSKKKPKVEYLCAPKTHERFVDNVGIGSSLPHRLYEDAPSLYYFPWEDPNAEYEKRAK